MNDHPPKPPLALAVGIVGHRPNRLPEAARDKVAAEVGAVLAAVAVEMESALVRYDDVLADSAVLSLVGSLAEGADRIAARAAVAHMDKGGIGAVTFALDAVLPFAADEFAGDFADDASRDEFRALLGKTRAVLELPGTRAAEARAYEAAAYTVLSQSDIVIGVWDGGLSGGHGGTTETIEAAARDRRPIVVVDATGKAAPRLHWAGLSDDVTPSARVEDLPSVDIGEGLPRLVDALVRPPAGSAGGRLHHQDEGQGLGRYFAETALRVNPFLGFPLLMATFCVRGIGRTDLLPPRPETLAQAEARFAPPVPGDEMRPAAQPTILTASFGWADFVGTLLAQIFRSAFILNFIFAALAVVCAAVSIVQHDWKPWLVRIEIGLILIVLVNTWLGWRRQWHRRWLEGRELAERLRVAMLLWMLGLRIDGANGAEPTWTGWYARAAARAQGLRHARLDDAGVVAAREAAANLLDDQCGYHATTAGRMHRLEKRLEVVGLICLTLTIIVAAMYLFLAGLAHGEGLDIGYAVAAATAGLPALATATYGIRVIGDFAGISRRSQRTHDGVSAITGRMRAKRPNLRHTRAEVRAAAEIMLGDVAGWRLSAESRGLAIPG